MKRFLCTLLIMALLLSLLSLPAFADVTGTGTEQDPYIISSYDDMYDIFALYDVTQAPFKESIFIRMVDDITLDSSSFIPVMWKNLTIDLNGHTLAYTRNALFAFGEAAGDLPEIGIPKSITVKKGALVSMSEGYINYEDADYLYQPAGIPAANDLPPYLTFAEYFGLNEDMKHALRQLKAVHTQFIFEDLSMDFDTPLLSYFPKAELIFENVNSNSFSLITNGDVTVRDCTLRSTESMQTDAVIHCLGKKLNVVNSTLVGNHAAVLLAKTNATFNQVSLSSTSQLSTAVVVPYGYQMGPNRPSYPNTYTLDGTEYYDNGPNDYSIYEGTSYVSPQGPAGENQNSQTTNVTYTIEESGQFSPTYTVSIPAQVRLNEEFVISVDELILDNGSNLVVTLDNASTNQQGFALFGTGNNANNSINYTVKCLENRKGETASAADWANADIKEIGNQVLSYSGPCNTNDGDNVPPTLMRFELVEDLSYVPGDYEGYVTFGIALVQN